MSAPASRRQGGFGAIVAVIVVVMLSALAAGIVRFSWQASTSSGLDAQALRARLAARAGIEWGLYKVLRGSWAGCTSSSQTLDLRSTTGMWVTVTCNAPSLAYVEGGDDSGAARSVRIHAIEAVACNGTSSCPDTTAATVARMGYVERRQRVSVSDVETLP